MNKKVAIVALAVGAAFASAPATSANEPSLGADLKATIALQGLPCDQIVSTTRDADSNYTATCKDGNRYHVYVNAQGRVIVEKI
jgi:hypothetical protein